MTIQKESQEQIRRLVCSPPARMVVSGPRRTGKHRFLLAELRSATSDQDLLEVEGSIDGARQAQHFVKTAPVVGDIRSVLVDGRSGFSEPAQDAYLKICEDIPRFAVIVIIVTDHGILRPALQSRLDVVRWDVLTDADLAEHANLSGILKSDFVIEATRGRIGLYDPMLANTDEMKQLHAAVCDVISGKVDLSSAPKLILEWAKLEDDVKDAALSVCEHALRSNPGPRTGAVYRFVETVSSIPSANAEIHWWRACMT
jgi:hypothetical protein